MRERIRAATAKVVIAMALASAMLPLSASPAGADACASKMEYVTLNTLHVNVGSMKKSYRRGDVVTLRVRVSRPSENDPIGLGFSMDRPVSNAAEDINIGVGLSIGRVFLPGYGLSNEEGRAKVRVKIEKFAPANKMAHAQVFAYYEQANTPCLVVEEQGYEAIPNAFKVTR